MSLRQIHRHLRSYSWPRVIVLAFLGACAGATFTALHAAFEVLRDHDRQIVELNGRVNALQDALDRPPP